MSIICPLAPSLNHPNVTPWKWPPKKGSAMWWLGDWANYGERQYGDIRQAADALGYERGSFWNAKWVASSVGTSRRREVLSFAHHQEVAPLQPKEQSEPLTQAADENWSRQELRQAWLL